MGVFYVSLTIPTGVVDLVLVVQPRFHKKYIGQSLLIAPMLMLSLKMVKSGIMFTHDLVIVQDLERKAVGISRIGRFKDELLFGIHLQGRGKGLVRALLTLIEIGKGEMDTLRVDIRIHMRCDFVSLGMLRVSGPIRQLRASHHAWTLNFASSLVLDGL
ncbi:hypothetical protein Tco_1211752 [Tanacetum coccineum]